MNKSELIVALAQKAELSKKDAEKALTAFVDVVTESLKAGDKVQLAPLKARIVPPARPAIPAPARKSPLKPARPLPSRWARPSRTPSTAKIKAQRACRLSARPFFSEGVFACGWIKF